MPTIYIYFGFTFSFFANDHLPVHLHIRRAGRESIILIEFTGSGLSLSWKKQIRKLPLTESEMKESEIFVRKHHLQIIAKWNQFFIYNKSVSPVKVSVRVK